jgi:dual specificity tyrosine-phosphorylation-regulated kinase 2/3/4
VALKISRNKKFDVENAEVEYKILRTLKDNDPTDRHGVVRILDFFHFRKHVILVFELLSLNLYKYMKKDDFKPFSRDQLKNLTL